MKVWGIFILIWIPLGRLCFIVYELRRLKITLWELLTTPMYHKIVVEQGFFGLLTPFFLWLVHRPSYLKKYRKKAPTKKNLPELVAEIK